MKQARRVKARGAILYTLLSSAVLFQTPELSFAAEADPFSFDQVVVTASRVPTKVSESAANVTVITREDIQKGNYRNLSDILQNVPGVQIALFGNPGSVSTAFINGSEQVVIMIDGRRMNLPNGSGGFGMATINLTSFIGLENVERIEIVKSGMSALYGADAVGGVINIITKRGEKNQTTVKVSGGNWNGKNYTLSEEGKEGDLGWYFAADKKRLGDYATGNGRTVKYTGVDQNAYTLRLDQTINKGSLSFTYENLNNENEERTANDYEDVNQHNFDFTYKLNTSANTDYQIKMYQNASHRFGDSWGETFDHDVRIKGVNYQINSKITEKHSLTTGFDWRKDSIESSIYGSKDDTVQGTYLQEHWKLSDQFSLISGLRYDKNDTYGNKTTPQVSANYKQNDRTAYYASWGKVFQAPRFDDLYWPHQHYDANPAWGTKDTTYDGNPNLKPETGWNIEIGMNHKFDNTVEGKVSYFNRRLHDAINWSDISTDSTKQHWVPSNVDEQKAYGIEAQVSKQITDAIKGFVGYNYINVQNKKSNGDFERDPNIASTTWNLGVQYAKGKVNADIKGNAVMGRTNPSFIEKNYWVWNLNMNVNLSKEYTAFLTVDNIFDKYYDGEATYPCGGRQYIVGIKATF